MLLAFMGLKRLPPKFTPAFRLSENKHKRNRKRRETVPGVNNSKAFNKGIKQGQFELYLSAPGKDLKATWT